MPKKDNRANGLLSQYSSSEVSIKAGALPIIPLDLQNLITSNRTILDCQYSIPSLTLVHLIILPLLLPHVFQLSRCSLLLHLSLLLSADASVQLRTRIHLSQLFSRQVSQQISYPIMQNTNKQPGTAISQSNRPFSKQVTSR